LVGPAFSDRDLARLGSRLHRKSDCGSGLTCDAVVPLDIPADPVPEPMIELVVAGAHLSGMALNHQLLELGASLVAATRTAPDYRLFALGNTLPEKPGLVRTPGLAGAGIEVELWQLREPAFARFVASLPPPMVIGKVRLDDGRLVPGFLCEPCVMDEAVDITSHGGWRAYVGSRI